MPLTLTPVAAPAGLAIDIWQLEMDLTAQLPQVLWHLLSEAEQQHFQRFRRHSDQQRFALVRASLRQLLGARLGADPDRLPIETGPHGKPQLAGLPLHFNVSHAGELALIAISADQPVGIDIERAGSSPELADYVCSNSELAYLAAQAERAAAFLAIWAGKEAVLKAWGCGISEPLNRLTALPGPRYQLAWDEQPLSGTEAWALPVPTGFAAALAVCDQTC
ncbi:4'-phosphopantetheinyl transferase superfamily protein [Chitinimonas sp.]|uniref:4'-phosphopantetheinyl transferase family protein n=1 Tax=Chitinimonas sp. TaxID=1934313 RepID=UPI0035B4F854